MLQNSRSGNRISIVYREFDNYIVDFRLHSLRNLQVNLRFARWHENSRSLQNSVCRNRIKVSLWKLLYALGAMAWMNSPTVCIWLTTKKQVRCQNTNVSSFFIRGTEDSITSVPFFLQLYFTK